MALNATRSGLFYNKEVLKYAQDNEVLRSYVLDSVNASIAPDTSGRYVYPAGTVFKENGSANRKVIPYDGFGTVVGISALPIELSAVGATSADTAVGLYSNYAIFATTKVVGFTVYVSQLISSLPTCKFE